VGMAGTGGISCSACMRALVDSCDSEACRHLSIEKRAVLGVAGWMGGDGGRLSLASDMVRTLRGESSEAALWAMLRVSSEMPLRLGASGLCEWLFRKRPSGSRVERRLSSFSPLSSFSLGFGLSMGIAAARGSHNHPQVSVSGCIGETGETAMRCRGGQGEGGLA
jgi:hypothetical protein